MKTTLKQKKKKKEKRPRAEDILFWPRMFGVSAEVEVEKFANALYIHLNVVERQKIDMKKDLFVKMVSGALHLPKSQSFTRNNWVKFIERLAANCQTFTHICKVSLKLKVEI